jgi:hypothetical protein
MQRHPASRIAVLFAAACVATAQAQDAPASGATPSKNVAPVLPPRATPADYQAHAQAGSVTIAAEFKGHSVPTPEATFSTEDYIVVELGLFGAPDTRMKIAAEDFSLRINGKKAALPSQPFGRMVMSAKDPEWVPPEPAGEKKSKTGLNSGGGGGADANLPPAPVKVPIAVQRAMEQRIQKATLPEGDRALPQAGLLYFQYRGKTRGIQSIELIYSGSAGKATLALQP